MILFLISLLITLISLIVVISVATFSKKDFGQTTGGPIFSIILCGGVFFGLILIPIVNPIYIIYEQVFNYQILKAPGAIIVDLTNSTSTFDYSLKKFNSYKAVTEFSDSTLIYVEKEKSFYKVTIEKRIVWSNPPYQYFNKE